MKPLLLALVIPLACAQVTVRLFSIATPDAVTVIPRNGARGEALRPGVRLPAGSILRISGRETLAVPWPIETRALAGRLGILVRMPLEDYVAGVLAGESTVLRSEEALKAMAVTVRTYAAANRGRHRAEGFDFCDTTHCQDLRVAAIAARLRDAAQATEGEILWYDGSPAQAFYHRNCGGMTEAASDVWPGAAAPYLRSQPDTFCARGEWQARISQDDVGRALGLQRVENVAVLRRSPSGRALELRAGGRHFSADAFHLAVGRALGWNLLRSTRYEVARAGSGFLFQGYGSGHGVGLCQDGAGRRGLSGHTYRQILDFYFPGAALGVSARGFTWRRAGGERVDVDSTHLPADGFVAGLADRALQAAERRAGFVLAFRPCIRIYPTVAAFRDSTGEPGWVAASTLSRTVRMQPAGLLRSRGVLDEVLLHEMLHLLVESRARADTPDWFREGLPLYLGGGQPSGGSAAQREYRQARACVEALAKTHGRAALFEWLERGLPVNAARCPVATVHPQ